MIRPVFTTHAQATEALQLATREIVALTGGGGKTSLMALLARELQVRGSVITTTTTKIARPEPGPVAAVILTREQPHWEKCIREALRELRHVTVADYGFGGSKLKGLEGEAMEDLLRRDLAPHVLIEADGARQKPLKAPRQDEPLVPQLTTLVVGLIGWDILGRELVEENVHRSEIFRGLLGLPEGHISVSEPLIERWVVHPRGLLKNIPAEARFVFFLNKCDDEKSREEALRLASSIVCRPGSPCRHAVVGSIRNGVFISVHT